MIVDGYMLWEHRHCTMVNRMYNFRPQEPTEFEFEGPGSRLSALALQALRRAPPRFEPLPLSNPELHKARQRLS
jgi:hypothetical protein